MPAPVAPSPRRIRTTRTSLAVPLTLVVVAGAVGGAVAATAPEQARTWVVTTVVVAWVCVAVAVVSCALALGRGRRGTAKAAEDTRTAQAQLARTGADSAHLVNVTLPAVVKRVREGAGAEETLAATPPPSDLQLRRALEMFVVELADAEGRAARAVVERDGALGRLERGAG
ncbi:ATP-binding protein, partial [Streptomyces sp. NPDC001780]